MRVVSRATRRTSASIAVAVLALTPLGACSWLKGHVYHAVPVANAVGDSTTALDGAKVHTYVRQRYEVFAPSATAVVTASAQLDRAYFQWTRYFGGAGPHLALVLFDHPDSLSPTSAGAMRQRGLLPVVYVRPRDARDVERPHEDVPRDAVWPVSGAIARAFLAAYAAERTRRPMPPFGAAAYDTLLDAYPGWFRGAIVGLLGDPAAPDRAYDLVRDRGDALVPLATLLTRRRFDIGDSTQKPVRELAELIDAEGLSFALFAAEREGPRFVGHLADVILAGGTGAGALLDARQMPRDVADVERLWRKWIDDQS